MTGAILQIDESTLLDQDFVVREVMRKERRKNIIFVGARFVESGRLWLSEHMLLNVMHPLLSD